MAFNPDHGSSLSASNPQDDNQEIFKKLKTICVPLLGNSRLDHQSLPKVASNLSELILTLKQLNSAKVELRPSLISYVFFPISTLFKRNAPATIPDYIMEKLFIALKLLFEHWWWGCDLGIWEEVVKLTGAILGGIDGRGKGKEKERDDETKEAAVNLLLSLLRDRSTDVGVGLDSNFSVEKAHARQTELCAHSQTPKFIPVIGQTLTTLLSTAASPHLPLQLSSLRLVNIIISQYLPDTLTPSFLPGVASSMTRIALGQSGKKGKAWANGAVVVANLGVLEVIIVRAVGNAICISAGIVRELDDLEDLTELASEPAIDTSSAQSSTAQPYTTSRTSSWLRGTSSQLLIALNTLTPLISHPTPLALLALSTLACKVLSETHLTLPQARPLLLSFLLSLSNSPFGSVSSHSRDGLISLLTPPSKARHVLLQTVLQSTADSLAALPRLLPSHADAKTEHLAGQIEAVCRLGNDANSKVAGIAAIRTGVGKLLGPTGHIEKWGWSLLSVLEFVPPIVSVTRASGAQLMLESDLGPADLIVFPEVTLRHVSSRATHSALERMLWALGQTGGEDCLFSVEWFIGVGRGSQNANATAALWCACKLLEGVSGISLDASVSDGHFRGKRKGLEKLCRWLTKAIAELWSESGEDDESQEQPANSAQSEIVQDDGRLPIEFVKGLIPLQIRFDMKSRPSPFTTALSKQPFLHKALLLQLLCIASAVLQARFNPLLLHALYPILHSLVSPVPHLSSTALAALQYVTNSTGYATPANLLLSNFDYALDAVSRRLTRRWLDVDATKVLVVLVRLVGRDVVQRAGDVVEECFDRLDDFHGYEAVVEGLVDALSEVVKVVEQEDRPERDNRYRPPPDAAPNADGHQRLDAFIEWFEHRHDPPAEEEKEDFGPAPREAWGKIKEKEADAKEEEHEQGPDPLADPPHTPTQALTKQIVSRSLYFLTHGSPLIRARILTLLSASVPVLPESALLPSVHKAWPFVLNRLSDAAPFVVSSAASFVEALATHVGPFMTVRVWDDVWPRFRTMLRRLDEADSASALARRGAGAVGTDSAYTYSHRLYRSMLRTMTAAVKGVQIQDAKAWDVIVAFRRFLHRRAHEELQDCARQLYAALGENNEDAVWLALVSTMATGADGGRYLEHLRQPKWDIKDNVDKIFANLDELQNA